MPNFDITFPRSAVLFLRVHHTFSIQLSFRFSDEFVKHFLAWGFWKTGVLYCIYLAATYPAGVPRHTYRTIAQVIRAPRLAGDRNPGQEIYFNGGQEPWVGNILRRVILGRKCTIVEKRTPGQGIYVGQESWAGNRIYQQTSWPRSLNCTAYTIFFKLCMSLPLKHNFLF